MAASDPPPPRRPSPPEGVPQFSVVSAWAELITRMFEKLGAPVVYGLIGFGLLYLIFTTANRERAAQLAAAGEAQKAANAQYVDLVRLCLDRVDRLGDRNERAIKASATEVKAAAKETVEKAAEKAAEKTVEKSPSKR